MATLYVLMSGSYRDAHGAFFKIGHTTGNVRARKDALQTGNPEELSIYFERDFEDGAAAERFVQALLKPWHVRGEWYMPCSRILRWCLRLTIWFFEWPEGYARWARMFGDDINAAAKMSNMRRIALASARSIVPKVPEGGSRGAGESGVEEGAQKAGAVEISAGEAPARAA